MSIQTVTSGLQPLSVAGNTNTSATTSTAQTLQHKPGVHAQGAKPVENAAAPAAEPTPGMEQIHDALAEVQQTLGPVARNLLFSLDEDSGKTIITVVDSSTDEVIRQIPSEELVAISKALDKLQGLLIKQQA